MVRGEGPSGKDHSQWKTRAISRLKPVGEALERRLGLEDDKKWEAAGAKLSTKFGPAFTAIVEHRSRKFDIDVCDGENLEVLRERPHIIVANHPTPYDKLSQTSGISPDSAAVAYAVREATGENIHFFGHYGEKAVPFIQKLPEKWKKRIKRGHKGIMKGYNMAYANTDGPSREFIEAAERIFADGKSLLVYPFGDWHEAEQLEGNIKGGTALLAKKFGIPIIPIYIDGARTWKPGAKTKIVVGRAFSTEGMLDEEVSKKIEDGILGLKNKR